MVGPLGQWLMLDPKPAATGHYRPTPEMAGWLQIRCMTAYSACLSACDVYWDPVAYQACVCRCQNAYATRLAPNAPTTPC